MMKDLTKQSRNETQHGRIFFAPTYTVRDLLHSCNLKIGKVHFLPLR